MEYTLYELAEWRRRAEALAAGQPWDEVSVAAVRGTMLYGAEARTAISDGRAVP